MTNPYSHQARKRFGQNFLVDQGILQRMDQAFGVKPEDRVVEIGPGLGALTELLLARCPELDAIELDRDLARILQTKFNDWPGFRVHQADALTFDFSEIAQGEPLRVIGNLPYNISTPLIFHLLGFKNRIKDMNFMLQKEVVERMGAPSGTKIYGRLSIMCQYHCQVVPLFTVPPSAFQPAPKVDSAVVRLTPHKSPKWLANDEALLETLVRTVFQARRKTLRNGLKPLIAPAQLEGLGFALDARPETLSVADFVNLANAISDLKSTND